MEPENKFVNNDSDKPIEEKKVLVFTFTDDTKESNPISTKLDTNKESSNNVEGKKKDSNELNKDNKISKKTNNFSNYIFIISFLALIVFGIYSLVLTRITNNNTQPDQESPVSDAVSVDEISDFAQVCNGKKINNITSADSLLPRKTVLFIEETTVKDNYALLPVSFNKDWQTTATNYLETQVVGCLKLETEVDTGIKCKLKDNNNQQISLPLYNAVYELVLYDVKTANKINTQQLAASGNICPTFVKYNQDDPKIYSEITSTIINNGLEKYVTQ